MTPEEEARAVRQAEIVLVCIYLAAWIMGAGGVWDAFGGTLVGSR